MSTDRIPAIVPVLPAVLVPDDDLKISYMDETPTSKDLFRNTPYGIGPLTREKVRVRARALASIEGRTPGEVLQADYEQAKRELTGKSGLAQQEAMLDLLPETTLAIHDTNLTRRQKPAPPGEDEDQSENAQVAVTGVAAKQQHQILQAARAIKKRDRDEP